MHAYAFGGLGPEYEEKVRARDSPLKHSKSLNLTPSLLS